MRSAKPLHWLLFGSLALNLFFGGLLAASQVHVQLDDPAIRSRVRIDGLASTLPQADADRLHAAFQARASELAELSRAVRQSHDRQRALIRTQPYDAAAVAAEMAAARGYHDAIKRTFQETILSALADMSPEGREKLAAWASAH